MAEIVKSEPLGDGVTLDYWDNGRIQARNADGVFVAHKDNYSPPAAMSEIREGKTKRQSKPVLAEVALLLDALPADYTHDPRERWIIEHLASSMVVGGSGTASVARELILRLGLPTSQKMSKPGPGEPCPTCGRTVRGGIGEDVDFAQLRDFLDDLRTVMREQGQVAARPRRLEQNST